MGGVGPFDADHVGPAEDVAVLADRAGGFLLGSVGGSFRREGTGKMSQWATRQNERVGDLGRTGT